MITYIYIYICVCCSDTLVILDPCAHSPPSSTPSSPSLSLAHLSPQLRVKALDLRQAAGTGGGGFKGSIPGFVFGDISSIIENDEHGKPRNL